MDQVKFVVKNFEVIRLSSTNFTWSILEYLDLNGYKSFVTVDGIICI